MIRLDLTPIGKPRATQRDKWNPSPAVQRYRAFADELRRRAAAAGYAMGESVNVTFVFPMPASWSGRKRARMDGQPHRTKPDCDNAVKAILDSLLADDAGVHTIRARKVWGAAGAILLETEDAA